MTEAVQTPRGRRKTRVGRVVSNKMEKTAVVEIVRLVKHPVVKRYIRKRERFKIHDEGNLCHEGDVVRFMETRPLSKGKRWRFLEFVERVR